MDFDWWSVGLMKGRINEQMDWMNSKRERNICLSDLTKFYSCYYIYWRRGEECYNIAGRGLNQTLLFLSTIYVLTDGNHKLSFFHSEKRKIGVKIFWFQWVWFIWSTQLAPRYIWREQCLMTSTLYTWKYPDQRKYKTRSLTTAQKSR